jgi:hypothetical protein
MFKNAIVAIILGAAIIAAPPAVSAAAQDYRFELAAAPAAVGAATVVKIRLVHAVHGHPIDGAIIFQTRFDMGPEGMGSMTAPVKRLEMTDEPGVYAFETQPSMAGKWALMLAAKVQGESETVKGSLVVPVGK